MTYRDKIAMIGLILQIFACHTNNVCLHLNILVHNANLNLNSGNFKLVLQKSEDAFYKKLYLIEDEVVI